MWRIGFANNIKNKALANNKWVTVFREYRRLNYHKSDMDFCVTISVILDFIFLCGVSLLLFFVFQQNFVEEKRALLSDKSLFIDICLLYLLSGSQEIEKTASLKAKWIGQVQKPVLTINICIYRKKILEAALHSASIYVTTVITEKRKRYNIVSRWFKVCSLHISGMQPLLLQCYKNYLRKNGDPWHCNQKLWHTFFLSGYMNPMMVKLRNSKQCHLSV